MLTCIVTFDVINFAVGSKEPIQRNYSKKQLAGDKTEFAV
jgi:hypothetical protein